MSLERVRGGPVWGPAGPSPLFLIVVVLALIGPARAAAHEYWLSPSVYRARGGDEIQISAGTGEGFGGECFRYSRSRTVSLELLAAQRLDLTTVAAEGDSVFARFIAPDDSGAVVAYVSEPAAIEIPAEKFETYLAEDGLDQVRAARAQAGDSGKPGRERFRRCAKTWVAGTGRADANASALRLLRPAGLPAEIVPLSNPLAADTLRVRLVASGEPVSNALVHAWRRPLGKESRPAPWGARAEVGPAAAVRTDARGEAAIPLAGGRTPASGEWLVSAVIMVSSLVPESDWESTWASLTFARP
jgi:hypothetical protein